MHDGGVGGVGAEAVYLYAVGRVVWVGNWVGGRCMLTSPTQEHATIESKERKKNRTNELTNQVRAIVGGIDGRDGPDLFN